MVTYMNGTLSITTLLNTGAAASMITTMLKYDPSSFRSITWETCRILSNTTRAQWLHSCLSMTKTIPEAIIREILQQGTAQDLRTLTYYATPNDQKPKWDKIDRSTYLPMLTATMTDELSKVSDKRLMRVWKAFMSYGTSGHLMAAFLPVTFLPIAIPIATQARSKEKTEWYRQAFDKMIAACAARLSGTGWSA